MTMSVTNSKLRKNYELGAQARLSTHNKNQYGAYFDIPRQSPVFSFGYISIFNCDESYFIAYCTIFAIVH